MIEVPMIIGGLIVGIVVGMTGMGGGALMTPMLIFVFRIDPLVAVSSDVVASFFMKPAGALVHLRRKTVNLKLVGWLCLGSVPAAFSGALLIRVLPFQDDLDAVLKTALGIALILASAGLVARAYINLRKSRSLVGEGPADASRADVRIKPIPTVLLGAVAGLMVGMTSVGAGSVIIVILLMMYPALKASQLVGTDLVQAVPLVAAASVGHLLYGDFHAGVTLSLLLGAVPGAWFGAQISSRAPGGLIRRALAILLLASGLKLLGASYAVMLVGAGSALVGGTIGWEIAKSKVRGAAHRTGSAATVEQPVEEPASSSQTRSPDGGHQGTHP
ncbi:sulfite exporter TauE/SafE family protein [Brachybacterium sp. DNPG3]